MNRKKLFALISLCIAALTAILMVGCASGNEEQAAQEQPAEVKVADVLEGEVPTADNPIVVVGNEVRYLAEVNGEWFDNSTRHGVVYAPGSNGDKSVLRGLGDEKEFYQAMLDAGFTAGDNLVDEDMKAAAGEGKSVDGQKLDVTMIWDGQTEEIPFQDGIICSKGDWEADYRFGGNLESAKAHNTGCVLCLDSCATGITSDAAWPTGTTQNNAATFNGDPDVLPADGTPVVVIFRAAE